MRVGEVDDLVRSLGFKGIRRGQMSLICLDLIEPVKAFHQRLQDSNPTCISWIRIALKSANIFVLSVRQSTKLVVSVTIQSGLSWTGFRAW